jgi:hypothetical protein
MSNFLDSYTPIIGPAGENRITLSTDGIATLTPPTTGASAATIASSGGALKYCVNGQDPSATFGRPVPDGDEAILLNAEMIKNCKIIRAESATVYCYIQYYKNG